MGGGFTGLIATPLIAVLVAHGAQQAPPKAVAPVPSGSIHAFRVARLLPPRDEEAAIRAPEAPAVATIPATTPPVTPLRTARAVASPLSRPPATVAPAPAPGTIQAIIKAAADASGVSYLWMLKIATCESNLNPRAVNPNGPYIGLFQFAPSTFRAHGGTDIYDPVQQSTITATMLAHGQARAWACS